MTIRRGFLFLSRSSVSNFIRLMDLFLTSTRVVFPCQKKKSFVLIRLYELFVGAAGSRGWTHHLLHESLILNSTLFLSLFEFPFYTFFSSTEPQPRFRFQIIISFFFKKKKKETTKLLIFVSYLMILYTNGFLLKTHQRTGFPK